MLALTMTTQMQNDIKTVTNLMTHTKPLNQPPFEVEEEEVEEPVEVLEAGEEGIWALRLILVD